MGLLVGRIDAEEFRRDCSSDIEQRYKDPKARELRPLTKIHFLTEERLDSDEIRAVTLSSQSVGPDIGVPSLLTLPD